MIDYIIQPVLMGGLIKEVAEDKIKVHLHGRLGVITVSRKIIHYTEELVPGHEV